MAAFDDMTLGEVEEMQTVALNGKSMDQADPMMLAGAVMWMTARRTDSSLTWDQFKQRTRMADIKSFALDMEAETELDPTNVRNVPAN